jgi:S-adenosylmethionine:tRNA ribosyltransferase-isomerase
MKTELFHYELPPELIAQQPPASRTDSRMLVYKRAGGAIEHRKISDIGEYLTDRDLLVLNDTRVIPARMEGKRADTGGKAELLLLEEDKAESGMAGGVGAQVWEALFKARSRMPDGCVIRFDADLSAKLLRRTQAGTAVFLLESSGDVGAAIRKCGIVPLPPYIKRGDGASADTDIERYQTVYAREPGAVAAPTAGLHFTTELIESLRKRGVSVETITLHVGMGTFIPVKTAEVEEHQMHEERVFISQKCVDAIEATRKRGGRVVAVGTTTVRALESAAAEGGAVRSFAGRTSIFIYPPYKFKVVDVMLTNFHLPCSTLLMMVSAFAGREEILSVYRAAVQEDYRFYSYGDCMLIL